MVLDGLWLEHGITVPVGSSWSTRASTGHSPAIGLMARMCGLTGVAQDPAEQLAGLPPPAERCRRERTADGPLQVVARPPRGLRQLIERRDLGGVVQRGEVQQAEAHDVVVRDLLRVPLPVDS